MTKWICVQSYWENNELIFKQGNIYEDVNCDFYDDWVNFKTETEKGDLKFFNIWWGKLSKYFITLAEWREKRINEILNGD